MPSPWRQDCQGRLSSSCRVTDFVWHERMAGINGMRNRQAVLFLNDRKGPGIGKNLIPLRETMSRGPFKQPFIVQPDANPVVCLDSGRLQICRYEKPAGTKKSASTKFPVALLSGLLIQPRDLKSAPIVTQQIVYYDTPSLFLRRKESDGSGFRRITSREGQGVTSEKKGIRPALSNLQSPRDLRYPIYTTPAKT